MISLFVELFCSQKSDCAEVLIDDSIVIFYYDETLPCDIQRAIQVKLNQNFKYAKTFIDEGEFLNYLGNKSDVTSIQFIISGLYSKT
jgi:hypothetical protein